MKSYFTIEELCKSNTAKVYGIDNTPNDKEIINLSLLINTILNPIREAYGSPIRVSSGYRCKALNKAVNGSNTSQHLKGEAADIIPFDMCTKDLFNLIVDMINDEKIEVGQLINEHNYSWIHISLPTPKHHNEIKAL